MEFLGEGRQRIRLRSFEPGTVAQTARLPGGDPALPSGTETMQLCLGSGCHCWVPCPWCLCEPDAPARACHALPLLLCIASSSFKDLHG